MFLTRIQLYSVQMSNTKPEFWRDKINRNRKSSVRIPIALVRSSRRVGMVWECAPKGKTQWPLNDVVTLCSSWFVSDTDSLEICGLEYEL